MSHHGCPSTGHPLSPCNSVQLHFQEPSTGLESGTSNWPYLKVPGRRQNGTLPLRCLLIPESLMTCPGRVGLNTSFPVAVRYLSGRRWYDGSEATVLPVALVMPPSPPSYSYRLGGCLSAWWGTPGSRGWRGEGRNVVCQGRLHADTWLSSDACRTVSAADSP